MGKIQNPIHKCLACVVTLAGAFVSDGCGMEPTGDVAAESDVLVSVINVTPFTVEAVLSGVLNDSVDTVRRTVEPSDSSDTRFVCIDQLVVGDPLDPTTPGVTASIDGELASIDPFSIFAGESFACGDVIEIIVSGVDVESLAVDVFALTPP